MGHPIVWGGWRRTGNGKGKSRSFDSVARKVRRDFAQDDTSYRSTKMTPHRGALKMTPHRGALR